MEASTGFGFVPFEATYSMGGPRRFGGYSRLLYVICILVGLISHGHMHSQSLHLRG
jgi:hypothetical protein